MESRAEENQTIKSFGKSLLVPSVQELVMSSQQALTIPPRYIHSQPWDPPLTSSGQHLQLPIVDMEDLVRGDPIQLHNLHLASQEWGFFQVVNHGVSNSLIERFKMEVEEFFNLPMEEKRKYWQTEEELEGFGQAFVMSEEQKLDWADIFLVSTLPKNTQKPNLVPMLPPSFRETLEEYAGVVQKLSMQILECMAESMGMTENKGCLRAMFGEAPRQFIRMNYYPPCPEPDRVMGLTPHSDACGLTILLQANQMEGLHIKKDGCWISVNPLPGAFIVNVGDALEIMSNGEYQSVEHRAVVNPIKERISIAAFHIPGLDQEIGPAPCLITPHNPPRFQTIKIADYMSRRFASKLNGKSNLHAMRIH